jgi:hypothetical protein
LRRSGGGVDAEFAELAVERRAADAEAAHDFGHAPAIMADGEADDVFFVLMMFGLLSELLVDRVRSLGWDSGVGRRLGVLG